MLHLGIKAGIGYVDPAHVGIGTPVAENIHQLEGLTEPASQGQQFLQGLGRIIGNVLEANAGPKFAHTASHEISVFLEFVGRKRRCRVTTLGRTESFDIEYLTPKNNPPNLHDGGRIRKSLQRLQELRQTLHEVFFIPLQSKVGAFLRIKIRKGAQKRQTLKLGRRRRIGDRVGGAGQHVGERQRGPDRTWKNPQGELK